MIKGCADKDECGVSISGSERDVILETVILLRGLYDKIKAAHGVEAAELFRTFISDVVQSDMFLT